MAEFMRAELSAPRVQFMTTTDYDQLFTIHGTLMLLFFATPMAIGFGNYFIPLQIGAADMAFPRLNALSYWFFLFAGIAVVSRLRLRPGARRPTAGRRRAPLRHLHAGHGMDLGSWGSGWSGSPASWAR